MCIALRLAQVLTENMPLSSTLVRIPIPDAQPMSCRDVANNSLSGELPAFKPKSLKNLQSV